jgi:MFS family permease
LGFWVHFSCTSTAAGLVLLWGHPYLMLVGGFSSAGAGMVLFVGVLVSGAVTPFVGWVFGRRADLRVPIALVLCTATISAWLVLSFGFGDTPPAGLVAPVVVATVLGLPAAMAGSAIVRDAIAPSVLGTASGVVNMGGYLAAMVAAAVSGGVIAMQGGTGSHSLRLAMVAPLVVQAVGLARCVVWGRRMGDDVPRVARC